ncbi:TolC family protein [Luteolibacter sp. AS25]|uniref:TolC family protein n=1 Tax=Luteolibacter sp. AS25 TaxID=3135776 RepID=UPI00398B2B52
MSAILSGFLSAEPVEILTYQSIQGRIRHSNPTLAAAKFRINEALGNLKQSGRLSNPTLDTGLSHNIRSAEGEIEIGLSQKFPITNRLALEKEISLAEVEAAEAEVRDVERLLIAEARAEFIRILSLRERRALLAKEKKLAAELTGFITSASERGEISSIDAAQARLAGLSITTEERRLSTEETSILGKLRPLLGMEPTTAVQLSGNPPGIDIPATSSIRRPDLNAAKHLLDAAGSNIALEQAHKKEDIEASIFAAAERSEDAPEGLENEGIVGFKLSIPFPFWNDNQGNIEAATAIRDRRAKEIEALTESILHESQTALTEMRQWLSLIAELENSLIPLTREQTGLLEDAYTQGQGDLQAVLTSRKQTLELLATKIDASREFQLARIRYEASRGNQ